MKLEFKSWVPNVTGHISFSVIGSTAVHARPRRANQSDLKTRYLICHQRRDLGDTTPKSNFISKHLWGLDGVFWFACVARTYRHDKDQFGELRGKLFIYRDANAWEPVRGALDGKIHLLNEEYRNSPVLEAIFDEHRVHLEREISRPAMFAVDFSLLRTGVVTIIADDQINEQGFSNFPRYENDDEKLSRIRSIAAQMFYFLKDICHEHKHHNPATDTIVDLHRSDQDGAWCREVLYSLYRKIINERRSALSSTEGLSRSLGVMAYADSFSNLLRSGRVACDADGMPVYQVQQTRASIEALMTQMSIRTAHLQGAWALMFGVLFGSMGVVLAVAALVQLTTKKVEVEPAGPILWLAKFILANPRTALFVIAGGILVFFLEMRRRWSPGRYWAWRASLVRLAHAFPKALAGWGLIVLALVAIGAAVQLVL